MATNHEWTYNPISYYLLILKRDQEVITHIEYKELRDSVIGLFTYGYSKSKPEIDLITSESQDILLNGYSSAYSYDNGDIGVIFTSKYLNNPNTSVSKSKIGKYILRIEREKKLNKLLDESNSN
jgi:hypothetical protein